MSEKYKQIGAPMTELPRPVTTGNYSRIESALGERGGTSSIRFHDCSHNATMTLLRDLKEMNGSAIKMSNHSSDSLHICVLNKDELLHTKDAKFAPGIQVSCPYLLCNYKNSQFQQAGRFPSEFLLNHLHSNHKHRRYNGDNLDLTMVVPQVEVTTTQAATSASGAVTSEVKRASSQTNLNGIGLANISKETVATAQTWPFVEIYAYKRYFYLEAQSFTLDGHPELFVWLWFLGSEQEELHYRYQLTVIHGKSEYSYKGPVVSLVKSANDIKNDGRCLVIRERVWDYMSYKLKITKH